MTDVKSGPEKRETSDYSFIRMPPKMMKRGRPKGAELTVSSWPSKIQTTQRRLQEISAVQQTPSE